jgi:WD40 repeat protein
MLRFLVTVVLGAVLALGAAWYFGLWPPPSEPDGSTAANAPGTPPPPDRDLGDYLYRPAPEVREPPAPPPREGPAPVVIPDGHIVPVDKQVVASQKEGELLFVGQEVSSKDAAKPSLDFTVSVRVGDKEKVFTYRELDRYTVVSPGALVAMLDPRLALAELAAAEAKKQAAEADFRASRATYKEYQAKVQRLERLRSMGTPQAVSIEEFAGVVLARERYLQETFSKAETIKLAQAEINKAKAVYSQHEIRNKMHVAAAVAAVYRRRGDTVKAQEPILELYGLQRLRAEGRADVRYRNRLHVGDRVVLEPIVPEGPLTPFPGHRGEINAVAFAGQGPGLRIVSGSQDATVRVWGPRHRGRPLRTLRPREAVKALACSPPGSGKSWCVAGCADGSLHLWDLDAGGTAPKWEVKDAGQGAHGGAVTALAFSPDGKFIASGGEDNMIHLWRADTGQLVYRLDPEHGADRPHEGPVTSLHFTPQCRLISAGRDNTLRVWRLKAKGVVMDGDVLTGRGGTVAALGVSQDGGRMVLDRGPRLQVLSVPGGHDLAELQGTFGLTPFETLALFSPDGSLLLTSGAPEGRMQLWRVPEAGERACEVRRFSTEDHAPASCAAFSPDGSLAASGTKDGTVYLWQMPTRAQVAGHRVKGLTLTQVDHALDANAGQVRLAVAFRNPVDAEQRFGRLVPGLPVTIVLEP